MREVIRFWMPEFRPNTFALDHSASTSSLEAGPTTGKIFGKFFFRSNFKIKVKTNRTTRMTSSLGRGSFSPVPRKGVLANSRFLSFCSTFLKIKFSVDFYQRSGAWRQVESDETTASAASRSKEQRLSKRCCL